MQSGNQGIVNISQLSTLVVTSKCTIFIGHSIVTLVVSDKRDIQGSGFDLAVDHVHI